MKTWFAFLLLTLGVGLVAGSWVSLDSGYVLISWHTYTMETTVWAFCLLLLLLMALLYVLVRLSLVMLGNDFRFNEWRRQRKLQRARRMTTRGLLNLAQGQWRTAERQLAGSAEHADTPLINYLAAARAAYEQGKHDHTDELLNAASQSTKGSELAVGISHVQLLQSRGQLEQALAVLLKLRSQHPKHAYVLKLLVKTYQELEDWVALNDLLPVLRKATKIPAEELKALEEKVQLQLLQRAAKGHHDDVSAELKQVYRDMPRHCRYSYKILLLYVELLAEQGNDILAEAELRGALKNVWHDDLIHWFGRLKGEDTKKQRLFAEQCLKERPNDPVLLLALARLTIRQQDLDKAREYLQTALRIKGLPELHAEMAQVMLQEGDQAGACKHFQLALRTA
ncbi:heme biosynthesis HemY N-terminal domain-containing protein [Bacterioplanes sanyensis]|nr:heme biosynthesis HemY N-terminal domain-containing protein [Bacterioplanes sanyensis]